MPILKQLVATSAQTKRRSRMDLTREMISAPLGDFRHTMHVGRSGDAFGDTSFLSSHSGEPTPETKSFPRSPRPGLLLRTFRSSKRSQSVNRVDEQGENNLTVSEGSPIFVKNAMSLPFLNDESMGNSMASKSLSSSPFKQQGELDGGGAAAATNFLELQERSFGDLTELPESVVHYGGGMKHAESVMSFHVDLGPSMLGEILNVMEKEDDDLGFEEGKNSEGRASPALSHHDDDDEEEDGAKSEEDEDGREQMEENGEAAESIQQACVHQDSSVDLRAEDGGLYTPEYTPEIRPKHMLHLDSSSMSSSGSAALDEKPNYQNYTGDTDSATFSAPPEEESNFSSFLDEEDDEIHV